VLRTITFGVAIALASVYVWEIGACGGTVLDGHHRVRILRNRNQALDDLPREVLEPSQDQT